MAANRKHRKIINKHSLHIQSWTKPFFYIAILEHIQFCQWSHSCALTRKTPNSNNYFAKKWKKILCFPFKDKEKQMKKNWKKVDKKFYTDIWDCIKNKTTNKNTPCALKQFYTKTGPEPSPLLSDSWRKRKKILCFPFKVKEKQMKKNRKKVDKKVHIKNKIKRKQTNSHIMHLN